jgi:hypothetical protein
MTGRMVVDSQSLRCHHHFRGIGRRGRAGRGSLGGAGMGFAWMPDEGADAHGELYRDDQRAAGRYYRSVSPRAALRSQAGRHAMSHSHRPRLASFGVAGLVPLGRSRSGLSESRRALNHLNRSQNDRPVGPEDRDYRGAGRGAHAARPASVARRPSGWSGPERWRRWA